MLEIHSFSRTRLVSEQAMSLCALLVSKKFHCNKLHPAVMHTGTVIKTLKENIQHFCIYVL